MLGTDMQARMVKNCTDAAFGYTAAAGAAYVNFWSGALGAWAQNMRTAADTIVPDRPAPPRSWYRHPDQPELALPRIPNPFELWTEMLAPKGPPAAWPMAFLMLAFGAQRSVAWPAAEASAALAKNVEVVTQSLSSYRSDSGYAVAQIIKPAVPLLALATPFASSFFPWLQWQS